MPNYLEEIRELERVNFGSNLDNFSYLINEENGVLTSYLTYYKVLDEIEIISVFTKEEYRNCNKASNLINSLKNIGNVIFLEVNENNYKAFNLYKKLGFSIYNKRENYYNNKDTAILMKWSR